MIISTELCLSSIKEQFAIKDSSPNILILGDSVFSTVSYDDVDFSTLYEMILSKINDKYNVGGIYYPGYHSGVFYLILCVLKVIGKFPSVVVLPINMRIFSPQWDFNPEHQCVLAVKELKDFLVYSKYDAGEIYDIDNYTSYDILDKKQFEYPLTSLKYFRQFNDLVNMKPVNDFESFERYRQIFIWHYLYPLTSSHRKFLLLKKIVELIKQQKSSLLTYITPINYIAAQKYIGIDFTKIFQNNVQIIKNYFKCENNTKILFNNYSLLLDSEYFTHKNDTTEHLNQNGREIISQLICNQIININKKRIKTKFKNHNGDKNYMPEFINVTQCWCGSEILTKFSQHYLICADCHTLVARQRFSDEFYNPGDDKQNFYGKNYWIDHVKEEYNFPDIFERSKLDIIERCLYWLKTILKYKLPPAKTLELGCAHGGLVYLMKLAGYDSCGTEMSPWLCNYAKKIFNIPMECGRIEDLSIENKSFDIIILMDVLEHMTDPLNSLKLIARILNDDGIIVIQTPCFRNPDKTYKFLKNENNFFLEQLKEKEHLYLFNTESIEKILKKAGFKYISFETEFFPYDMFIFAGKSILNEYSEENIAEILLKTTNGRTALALIDLFNLKEKQKRYLEKLEPERNKLRAELFDLKLHFKNCEEDRESRLEVIEEQGRHLGELEAQRNKLNSELMELKGHYKNIESDWAARLTVIEEQGRRLGELEAQRNKFEAELADISKELEKSEYNREEIRQVIEIIRNERTYRILRKLGYWKQVENMFSQF